MKKKILLILVVLVVLAGGGAGAWFFYLEDRFSAEASEAAIEEAPPPEPPGPPVYVEFSPIQVPLLGERGVEQMITLVIALQVADDGAGDEVIEMAPRLNDAFLLSLYGSLEEGDVMQDNGMVDLAVVKDKLMEAAAQVLGEDLVKDVLVQMIGQRRT